MDAPFLQLIQGYCHTKLFIPDSGTLFSQYPFFYCYTDIKSRLNSKYRTIDDHFGKEIFQNLAEQNQL